MGTTVVEKWDRVSFFPMVKQQKCEINKKVLGRGEFVPLVFSEVETTMVRLNEEERERNKGGNLKSFKQRRFQASRSGPR
jgi:hypothetical protein